MNRPEAGMWPLLERADDPWPWHWPADDLGYADALASPWLEAGDEEDYRRSASALQTYLDGLNRDPARFDLDTLTGLANASLVSVEGRTDKRPVQDAPRLMSVEEVARIGLDGQPDAGLIGTDEMLGPWVEALTLPRDREVLLRACAHWCLAGWRSPAQAWTRSRPAPTHAERAAARALIHAPLALWRVRADGDEWRLDDQFGIAPHHAPPDAIAVHAAGPRPLASGDLILARVLPVHGQWRAWGALLLPCAVEPADVSQALLTVLVSLRLRHRRATVDDALRIYGHHVARRLFVSCFRSMA